MKYKVINGANTIGRAPTSANNPTDNFGARGGQRFGSFTSPISGSVPPDRSIRLPPSLATRSQSLVDPDYVNLSTNKTERNKP